MNMPAGMQQALESELAAIEKTLTPFIERREAIHSLFAVYDTDPRTPARTPVKAGPDLNTMNMAKTVIRNAGRPLTFQGIEESIKKTYGVTPAKTLYQMLYKRAKAGDKLYRNQNGEFGLVEMNPEIRTVMTGGESAAA